MTNLSCEVSGVYLNKNFMDMLGINKKKRYPRKLKKAVAQLVTCKKLKNGSWEVTIVLYLKETTKWNRCVNRMVKYDGRRNEWILPFKDGSLRAIHYGIKGIKDY